MDTEPFTRKEYLLPSFQDEHIALRIIIYKLSSAQKVVTAVQIFTCSCKFSENG